MGYQTRSGGVYHIRHRFRRPLLIGEVAEPEGSVRPDHGHRWAPAPIAYRVRGLPSRWSRSYYVGTAGEGRHIEAQTGR